MKTNEQRIVNLPSRYFCVANRRQFRWEFWRSHFSVCLAVIFPHWVASRSASSHLWCCCADEFSLNVVALTDGALNDCLRRDNSGTGNTGSWIFVLDHTFAMPAVDFGVCKENQKWKISIINRCLEIRDTKIDLDKLKWTNDWEPLLFGRRGKLCCCYFMLQSIANVQLTI